MSDGDTDTMGTRAAILTCTVAKYREGARRRLMADPMVRETVY
jgi:hypothetical protein